ncbi:MAG: hypothetical protein QNJ70_08565 [Xenococcaceae cyanobacterium MO_207.B15]|nr:hypothetical protein [Xenococcaceae cyanobacterium MO_207.B15]
MLEQKVNQLRRIKRDVGYWLDDTKRFLLQPFSNQDFINQKEMRIVGLKRSGNHGIITWIRRHYHERIWHLNCVSPRRNPYRHLYEHYSREALKKEAQGIFSKKECLIYNYENYTLESITNCLLEKNHDLYLGKSHTRYDLLILRDPYNTFASMLKGQINDNNFYYLHTLPKNPKSITELWLDYAKEFLGETNYLQHNRVMLNYNQWVSDQDYRRKISEKLGLEFCDAGFNVVKNYGGGSSFNGTEFESQASKMDVLNRWQGFIDDDKYRTMFNQEIIEYSQKIFGHIKGTEDLVN